jgi:hypothetical protein
MKPSDSQVKVDVRAEPATEIFILDHEFRLRARGVGQVKTSVEPGLYKIKYRAGSRIVETHEEITGSAGTAHFKAPDVPYYSPAPLASSRTTHETHEAAASRLSRQVNHELGQGSEIFIFARAWTEPIAGRRRVPAVPRSHHAAKGLSIWTADGSLLIDIEKEAQVERKDDQWAGCAVAVDPGTYRLRVETPRWGALEMTLIATEGWQTQVFLLQDNYPDGKTAAFRPDLAGASVLLARRGKGFDSERGELRLAELARQSLANGRIVLSADELKRLFTRKSSSPMLGIYGAHALLARGARREISGTVKELERILGSHPDVDALRLALSSRPSSKLSFSDPPMLASSWSIIVKKAAKLPELVPAGSLASRAAASLWGSGPWLIWLVDQVANPSEAVRSSTLEETLSHITMLGSSKEFDPAAVAASLNDTEAALYSALVPSGRGQGVQSSGAPVAIDAGIQLEPAVDAPALDVEFGEAIEAGAGDDTAVQASPAQIGVSLGLPPSSLHATADDLSEKLSKL